MTSTARAYYNYGRWVVECPTADCRDARLVYEADPRTGAPTGRRLSGGVCANGHPFAIEMPAPEMEAQIVAVVSQRPMEADRAWYPAGHPTAVLHGQQSGQSIDDLRAENDEVAAFRSALRQHQRQDILDTLAALGVDVQPDGSFSGSVK